MTRSRGIFEGVIVVYFIIALEVLIMISPFAAFFYAAFNPILLFLAQWPSTRWLAAFFLPHMVLPPGLFLKIVRVAGSVLFVGGAVIFLVCAGQVYFNKIFRRGPVLGGLYKWIRHPQYVALGATGLGLAILWPRFLTTVLWVVMVGLYYLLAKDEERRMVNQFGDQYKQYSDRTGMFVPLRLERAVARLPVTRGSVTRPLFGFVILAILAIGVSFALRDYTIARLPLWSQGRVTALAILPGDSIMLEHRMSAVLELPEVRTRLHQTSGPILVYLVPQQYVMQGMIADTGPQWRLYEHHQTLGMIADWIFHPFRHLHGGDMMMHQGMTNTSRGEKQGTEAGEKMLQHGTGSEMTIPHEMEATSTTGAAPSGVIRRLIFLDISSTRPTNRPGSVFGINSTRVPLFFIDIDIHNLILLDVHSLGPGTGWGRVPTPMF